MKKASMLLLSAMVILILVLVLGYPQKLWNQNEPAPSSSTNISYHFTSNEPSSQESSEVDAMAGEKDYYTVREYDGHIGVFRNEDTEPFEEIQVDVNVFPETDRELLKKGIKAYTSEELNGIIEDYEG